MKRRAVYPRLRRAAAVAVLGTLAGAVAWLAWGPLPDADVSSCNLGRNGLWLGHRWFADAPADGEIRRLGARLRQGGIRGLFFHVGPLSAHGGIPKWSAVRWRQTLQRLRAADPGIRAFAWLGGVTSLWEWPAADVVDLHDPRVIEGIAATARQLVRQGGFDGIHYDLELLADGDPAWLTLLDRTRAAIGGAALSAAVPLLRPPLIPAAPLWTSGWLRQVGRHCDQVALMGYDTGMPTRRAYERFLAWQVERCCAALDGTKCRLLVGVPTYAKKTRSHDPRVENLVTAMPGVARGLQACADRRAFQGIALYAEWTTSDRDWSRLDGHRPGSRARRPTTPPTFPR